MSDTQIITPNASLLRIILEAWNQTTDALTALAELVLSYKILENLWISATNINIGSAPRRKFLVSRKRLWKKAKNELFLALFVRACTLIENIIDNRLYSILFLKRRDMNVRGTPVRAAIQWCLLEEVRCVVEARFNRNEFSKRRMLRDQLNRFIGEYRIFYSKNQIIK